jgi:hypothetical protein
MEIELISDHSRYLYPVFISEEKPAKEELAKSNKPEYKVLDTDLSKAENTNITQNIWIFLYMIVLCVGVCYTNP